MLYRIYSNFLFLKFALIKVILVTKVNISIDNARVSTPNKPCSIALAHSHYSNAQCNQVQWCSDEKRSKISATRHIFWQITNFWILTPKFCASSRPCRSPQFLAIFQIDKKNHSYLWISYLHKNQCWPFKIYIHHLGAYVIVRHIYYACVFCVLSMYLLYHARL